MTTDPKEAVLIGRAERAYIRVLDAQKAIKDAEYALKNAQEVQRQADAELIRYQTEKALNEAR